LTTLPEFFEERITFKPTYKFDDGCDNYDSSKKKRVPSWTDRIILRVQKPRRTVGLSDHYAFETDIVRHINLKTPFAGRSWFNLEDPPLNYPHMPVCEVYRDCPDIRLSDHRPVMGIWKFQIPHIIPERYAEFDKFRGIRYGELVRLAIPRCSIDPQVFEIETTAELTLTNISCIDVRWAVKTKPD